MQLCFTNIHSLIPKRDQLCSFLEDSNPDILAITETWLHSDIPDHELLPDNSAYNIFRHDRDKKRGGGVLLAIKKTLSSFCVNIDSTIEIVWTACITSATKILIGVCYRPPDSDNSFVEELRKSVDSATRQCSPDNIYLLGDFNFPQIDWSLLTSTCHEAMKFVSLTLDYNLFQVVKEPTRGTNILDLILTNAHETVSSILHVDGFSDHKLLQITLSLPTHVLHSTVKKIRDYNRGNYEGINDELEAFYDQVFLPSFPYRSVNENWILFKNKIITLVDKYIPLISISNDNKNPWFNKTLQSHRSRKKRLY